MWTAKDFENKKQNKWSADDFSGGFAKLKTEPPKPSFWDKTMEAAKSGLSKIGSGIGDSWSKLTGSAGKMVNDPIAINKAEEGFKALAEKDPTTAIKNIMWATDNLQAGVGDMNKPFYSTLQSIGGDKVPILKDLLASGVRDSEYLSSKGGTDIASQVIRTAPNMAGNMALAFMSGGASLPAQLGQNATIEATKQLARNPAFLNSLIHSYGGAYDQAREAGTDRGTAIASALTQAIPQALIEQSGGVEQLPTNVAKQGLLKTIGKTALEEGMEEVYQYPFEGLAKKAYYAPETPIFSMKDEAIINPVQMAQSGAVGAIAGGLFGGAGKLISGVNVEESNHKIGQNNEVNQAPIEAQPSPKVDFYTDQYGNTRTELVPEQLQLAAPEAKYKDVPIEKTIIPEQKIDEVYRSQYNSIEDIKTQISKYYDNVPGSRELMDSGAQAIADLKKTESLQTNGQESTSADLRGDSNALQSQKPYKTIGKAFSDDLINTGKVNLTGNTINGVKDLATLAQAYRDPRLETLRVIYTKGDIIVGTDAITSRMPGIAKVFIGDMDTFAKQVSNRMSRIQADGYYMLHNHPGKTTKPSQADVNATYTYAQRIPGFRGHLIINSNKYTEIYQDSRGQMSGHEDLPLDLGNDILYNPSKPHPLLDKTISSTSDLAQLSKKMQIDKNVSTAFFVDAKNNIRGIMEINNSMIHNRNNDNFRNFLRNQAVELGGKNVVIAGDISVENELNDLVKSGDLMDGIIKGRSDTLRDTIGNVVDQDMLGLWMGKEPSGEMLRPAKPTETIFPVQPPYKITVGTENVKLPYDTFLLTEKERFSPKRITPAELANLNQKGLYPNIQRRSDVLANINPPITQTDPNYDLAKGELEAPMRSLPREIQKPLENMQHPGFTSPIDENAMGTSFETSQERRQGYRDTADSLLEGSDSAKDKAGWKLARETMERNNLDVFGEETGKKINETIFRPIHDNEAKRTKFINKYVDMVKRLNLSKTESKYVQMLGEGKITEAELPANIDKTKIKNAIGEFRKTYDHLLGLANKILTQNGYAPVEYRKDYFPHFDDPSDPFVKVMKSMGFKVDNITLPTDIAGITHQFKPGKKWFGNFLQRTGDKTAFDAIEGFERYLHGISDVIYHTNDIQRLRAFETSIRTKYSPDNIKARIAEIQASDLSPIEQEAAIDALFEIDRGHLGSYVTNLREFTDTLAGKKSISDRNMEHKLTRATYNIFDNMNKQVARNMVNWNVSSWLTNFIPIAQAGGGIKSKNLLKATYDTIVNYISDDGFRDKSTFLTNRKGTNRISPTAIEQISNAGMAPMEFIDDITTQILTRGKYLDNIERGMSHIEAINNADNYVAGAVADRSKGSMPTAFNAKNPLAKLFTMFQLEINNQYSFFLKDLPREAKEQGGKWLAATLLKAVVGSYLYNELYEKLTGRRPAVDPIGTIQNALSKDTPLSALKSATEDVLENTPFIGGLLGGGRLPTQEALPDLREMGKAAEKMQDEGVTWEGIGDFASGLLKKPATFLLSPIGGGNQLRKTLGGIKAYNQGASMTDKGQMRFPIEQTPMNALRTGVFGQYSTPEAREYFDKDRRPLSEKQTQYTLDSQDPKWQYERFIRQREIDNLTTKIKEIAKDTKLSREEKDKRISKLQEKIFRLRAAQ